MTDATSQELQARIERLSRENDTLKSLVLQTLPCFLFALDRDGVFTLAEGGGLQKLGSEPGEWVGRNALEDWRGTAAEAHMRRALGGETFRDSLAIPGRLYYDVWYAPITNADGHVDGIVALAIEVTNERLTEAALRAELDTAAQQRERLEHFERVLNGAPVALWAFDSRGTCTLSEGGALSAHGFEPGEAVGFNARDLFEQPPLAMHLRSALAGRASSLVAAVTGTALYSWCLPLIDASSGKTTGAVMFGIEAFARAHAQPERPTRASAASPCSESSWRPSVEFSARASEPTAAASFDRFLNPLFALHRP